MAGTCKHVGRLCYKRVSSHKRNFLLKDYEILDKEDGKFKINNDYHNGYYSIIEMSKFDHCRVTEKCLSKRVSNIQNKQGNFLTLWEALSKPRFEFIRNEKVTEKREIKKQNAKEEAKAFNDFMKLMPVGSLHAQYKPLQGKFYEDSIF